MNFGAERLFQLSSSPSGPPMPCGCFFCFRNFFHSYLPVPSVGSRRSRPFARCGSRPEEKYAVLSRDTYAQLKVNPNWLATFQNCVWLAALPSVMSFSAARLSASRPNVDRFRESAYGLPPTVAVAKTGPCTDTL